MRATSMRNVLMMMTALVVIQSSLVGCSTTGGMASTDDEASEAGIVVSGSRVRSDGADAMGGVPAPPAPAPPPPPLAPPAMAPPSPVSAVSGESRAEYAAPPVVAPPTPRPGSNVQAGILTAGEYDDLQNPLFYNNYVDRRLRDRDGEALPYIDTRQAVTVAVTDASGRPAPFVTVEVDRAEGAALRLTTVADGTVVLFPSVDRLAAQPTIRILEGGRTVDQRRVTIGRDRRIGFTIPGQAQAVTAADLLLVIDATGSMGDEMNYLKVEIEAIVASLRERHPRLDLRIGLIVYRDEGDDYVVRDFPFTSDVAALQRDLAAQSANGGGDYPEAMDQALARGVRYPWRDDAVNIMMLVADAPPHDNRIQASWTEVLRAREERVHIVPIAGSGVADTAEFVMRAFAAATQSRYLFLTDDSGVGGAHQEPEAKCYAVTRLDSAVRRTLDGLISGRRITPTPEQIIRTVGPYNNGECDTGYRQ